MNEKKLKVLWICHFSDIKIRDHINFAPLYFKKFLGIIKKRETLEYRDTAVWVSNAIKEFEKYDDIDLTVVFPHLAINGTYQEFTNNKIHYKCFRSEDDCLVSFIKKRFFHKSEKIYRNNRRIISNFVKQISPDIVHVIGAENPYYSLSALDIPKSIPVVVSLQTLMNDPTFRDNYNIDKDDYVYRSRIEAEVIKRSDYIASTVQNFKDYVKQYIKQDAIFLHMPLAVGQNVDLTPVDKEYDFVYFATNIAKTADYAIEAFILACKRYPKLSLNLSGYCAPEYRLKLEAILKEHGLVENVTFTGSQLTHEDVIRQIKKSRFALLPQKIDLISSTIREAMACGLPVVTTITPATPGLNKDRESILLSEKGDYQAMANNMLRLVNDDSFASIIRENAIATVSERYSNEKYMWIWKKNYYEIMKIFQKGMPSLEESFSK